jgi:acyl-coenzyme A synthetase/AMP-(fatty) acid ligase
VDVLSVAAVTAPGASWRELKEAITSALHRHQPVAVHRVDHIPRNAMGKVPREIFRQHLLDALAVAGRAPAPVSPSTSS